MQTLAATHSTQSITAESTQPWRPQPTSADRGQRPTCVAERTI